MPLVMVIVSRAGRASYQPAGRHGMNAPMGKRVVYYVSGHGFGHARRSAELARELVTLYPELRIAIRSSAPAAAFGQLSASAVQRHDVETDAGAVEDDALTINSRLTTARLRDFLAAGDALVASEAKWAGSFRADVLLADAPFLAGNIAQRLGIPCIAITNFTWDWIYEPILGPAELPMLAQVRAGYAKMAALLKLPLGQCAGVFPQVTEAPLIASISRLPRSVIWAAMGAAVPRDRPLLLVGMRGGIDSNTLAAAARQSPDVVFLCLQPLPPGAPVNLIFINLPAGLGFSDVLSISDAVISKPGYGILAECLASGTKLLFPRRSGFREDEISVREAGAFMAMRELSPADFRSGNWSRDLQTLLQTPTPAAKMRTDGAAVCAKLLSVWLG